MGWGPWIWVGKREEMRVPGLVGGFEMASMTCKGRW